MRSARFSPQQRVYVKLSCARWKGWPRFPLKIPRSCLAMLFRRGHSVTVSHRSYLSRPGFLLLMDLQLHCHMHLEMQYHADFPMLSHKAWPLQSRRAKSLLLEKQSLAAKEF